MAVKQQHQSGEEGGGEGGEQRSRTSSGGGGGATAVRVGEALIPVVNKLQDICSSSGVSIPLDLPQVAVVGSQSSGKSSVIEALVGHDFLPRGNDVVTRRPLLLHLVHTNPPNHRSNNNGDEEVVDGVNDRIENKYGNYSDYSNSVNGNGNGGDGGLEYGEFAHLQGKKFYDFSQIRNEIQSETERGAGSNKRISDQPIRLTIYSPNVLDITLIDLPGITRVPVGDQPSDIEALIRTMIMRYIRPPTCLILAVTPANSDLANSDALQMAGNADPDGRRTIGVLTKLDIMDRGTNACDLLLGKVIPLQLGYVGVVNRSQEDIILNRSIKDALADEEKFFRSHPVYASLSDRCGIPQLARKLNQILGQHIKECLPVLRSRISSQLVAMTREYMSYREIPESKTGQTTLLLNILSKYSDAFSHLVEGKSEEISTSELSGGARIHYIFQSIFVRCLEEVDPCDGLSDRDIRTAIQNAKGPKSAVFSPEVPFEVLVRRQIARLLDPSLQCARFIYNELVKMSHGSMVGELQRFPILRKRVDEVVSRFLRQSFEPTRDLITAIIDMEMDYINTSHPKFIGGTRAIEEALREVKSKPRDDVESAVAQTSERSVNSRTLVTSTANGSMRSVANGLRSDKVTRANADTERNRAAASSFGMGIPSIVNLSFLGNHSSAREKSRSNPQREPLYSTEQALSVIHLQEPPTVLKSSEIFSEQEETEIVATKKLVSSYFDIVRKIIEDSVPKAIMHLLVNHAKRELHNVLIQELYRENLIEEMLQERGEVAAQRRHVRETLRVLRQAFQTLDELPLEAESIERGYSLGTDSIGLPKTLGLASTSSYI